ncbi:presqualene diphosphate synthase HpnD [Saccharomonospora xinjiangensis]|uniref:Squalene synthase HpnD n=1 Tax=Saccharomonospora xinjiangensis XJ-54 TaxID=882086 RepID=I0V7I6_9PSEU|nr:presqualene diphosphate synthase HpnD [Saccharomonospora xinjiangensis]EID56089.1 squalene synthase HpnD [Saccharomonospora xinjiangensis XJ-54]
MRTVQAYAGCVRTTRQQARNFSYGIRLLPAPKRDALSAVYAFARRIDDIGDGDLAPEVKLKGLENARSDLEAVGSGLDGGTDDPVLVALADATRRFDLPLDAFDDLIDGCRADVLGTGYPSFASLRRYCQCVAGSIGRLSLAVFGSPDRARDEPIADDLGVALQLTNILRDVVEDLDNGRVYLPADELRRFGCTLRRDEDGDFVDDPDDLLALLEFQAVRAQEWYERGLRLLDALDGRSRACCAAMAGIYHRLLTRMALRPSLVLRGRTALPDWEKALVACVALAGGTP